MPGPQPRTAGPMFSTTASQKGRLERGGLARAGNARQRHIHLNSAGGVDSVGVLVPRERVRMERSEDVTHPENVHFGAG